MTTHRDRLQHAQLYGILDLGYTQPNQALPTAQALLAGGIDLLQLRAKNHPPETITHLGQQLLPHCRQAGIPLIINDHLHVAQQLQADGLHLGQNDGSITAARQALGPHTIIGRSTHSLAQAQKALQEGADYLGYGPLYPTPTKPGRPALGLSTLAQAQQQIGTQIPLFAIGGINPQTLPHVHRAGARRIVIVSALLQAPDIQAATRAVKSQLQTWK